MKPTILAALVLGVFLATATLSTTAKAFEFNPSEQKVLVKYFSKYGKPVSLSRYGGFIHARFDANNGEEIHIVTIDPRGKVWAVEFNKDSDDYPPYGDDEGDHNDGHHGDDVSDDDVTGDNTPE